MRRTTPAPRYEDLQPLQDQFFQQRTEDASRRLYDGPLRRLDDQQAQYAPDPIHTPLERGVIDTSRMALPGAYDAGNAAGRISRGEDAWGDLATNTAFAALPFLGVRGARGEPAPLPMREPFPDFGRPPAESPQASSGTGDARSPDLTPANGPIRSTPNMTPERLSQLMSRTRDLEDHTPLDIRIRIDRARQERQMQQAMAGIENWTPQQVAHFHSLIERMDPVAAERFKDVLSRRIAELRTQGLFDDFGAELRSRASPDANAARPVQASDGNAASGEWPNFGRPQNEFDTPFFRPSIDAGPRPTDPMSEIEWLRRLRNRVVAEQTSYEDHWLSDRGNAGSEYLSNRRAMERGRALSLRVGEIDDRLDQLNASQGLPTRFDQIFDEMRQDAADGQAPADFMSLPRRGNLPNTAVDADFEQVVRQRFGLPPELPSRAPQSPNANAARPPPSSPKSLPRKPPQGGFTVFGAPR